MLSKLLAAATLFLSAAALAETTGIREIVVRAPVVDAYGHRETIDVTVHRPEGPGPFPIVVLSHGSPRSAADRRAEGRQRLARQSQPFLAMGYAVVVPTRRGYGESGGEWSEAYGRCSDPDYFHAGLETARDIRAAVEAVRREKWVDGSRVILAGQSAGGFGSIAAASTPFPGLVAVVNFAGGRGSLGPDNVCYERRLVDAMGQYGATARVPTLWIYSVNDRFFGPNLAKRMHTAFIGAGGNAEFIHAPPTGDDGHGYFAWMTRDWTPRVEAFLRKTGALPARS
jgi:pimeloyl-ACP methyl ester carboxylesterase